MGKKSYKAKVCRIYEKNVNDPALLSIFLIRADYLIFASFLFQFLNKSFIPRYVLIRGSFI